MTQRFIFLWSFFLFKELSGGKTVFQMYFTTLINIKQNIESAAWHKHLALLFSQHKSQNSATILARVEVTVEF